MLQKMVQVAFRVIACGPGRHYVVVYSTSTWPILQHHQENDPAPAYDSSIVSRCDSTPEVL